MDVNTWSPAGHSVWNAVDPCSRGAALSGKGQMAGIEDSPVLASRPSFDQTGCNKLCVPPRQESPSLSIFTQYLSPKEISAEQEAILVQWVQSYN